MATKITAGHIVLGIVLGLIASLGIFYLSLDKTRKTYIDSILKQVPDLVARYSV